MITNKRNALASGQNQQAAAIAALLKTQVNPNRKAPTLREIAAELNRLGFRTRHGKSFHPMTIKRLLVPSGVEPTGSSFAASGAGLPE